MFTGTSLNVYLFEAKAHSVNVYLPTGTVHCQNIERLFKNRVRGEGVVLAVNGMTYNCNDSCACNEVAIMDSDSRIAALERELASVRASRDDAVLYKDCEICVGQIGKYDGIVEYADEVDAGRRDAPDEGILYIQNPRLPREYFTTPLNFLEGHDFIVKFAFEPKYVWPDRSIRIKLEFTDVPGYYTIPSQHVKIYIKRTTERLSFAQLETMVGVDWLYRGDVASEQQFMMAQDNFNRESDRSPDPGVLLRDWRKVWTLSAYNKIFIDKQTPTRVCLEY